MLYCTAFLHVLENLINVFTAINEWWQWHGGACDATSAPMCRAAGPLEGEAVRPEAAAGVAGVARYHRAPRSPVGPIDGAAGSPETGRAADQSGAPGDNSRPVCPRRTQRPLPDAGRHGAVGSAIVAPVCGGWSVVPRSEYGTP